MPKHHRRSRSQTRTQPHYLSLDKISGTSADDNGNTSHRGSSSANQQAPEKNAVELSLTAKPISICSWTGQDIIPDAASPVISPDKLSSKERMSQITYPIPNFNDFSINIPNTRVGRSPTIRPLDYSFTSSTAVPEDIKDINPGGDNIPTRGRDRTVTPVVIAGGTVSHDCRSSCNTPEMFNPSSSSTTI
ncbi:hypothetical protein Clacol_006976 [Clathrus columnatus]|uniref:Uncharacterized protein n=1 Tax=Clathrus columnatus TaxID=1419009 RepID=A0AAV5AGI4_9AGAM|nr:hypothetical protein Clacol_006976 [Clathrus columnatus]